MGFELLRYFPYARRGGFGIPLLVSLVLLVRLWWEGELFGWVKGEAACKASLCEYGHALAEEWKTRCSSLEESNVVDQARHIQTELAARTAEAPTECGKRLEAIVRQKRLHRALRPVEEVMTQPHFQRGIDDQ